MSMFWSCGKAAPVNADDDLLFLTFGRIRGLVKRGGAEGGNVRHEPVVNREALHTPEAFNASQDAVPRHHCSLEVIV